jgi:thioredoxin-like negative regulator of GroEL
MALRGVLLLKSNRPAEAEPLLTASLEDHIPREAVHRALALIAAARGDTAAAVEWLQAGSEAFPQDLQVRLELANALMRAQRWDDAAAEYAGVVERNPKDDNARRAWAQAIFNAGDYPGAAKILAPALTRRPDDPDILLLHANLLAKEGKMDQAKQVFDDAKTFKAARDERERAAGPPAAVIAEGTDAPMVP